MKGFAMKHYASKSVVREAGWMMVFAVCLLLLGVTAARLSVAHAQNMPMQMAQNKNQATDQKMGAHEVSIDNFSFAPMEMTIPAGSQVTWINKDDVPHTVVSVDHQFKSKALDTDEKFSFTFPNPGTYEYFCSVHPKMTGKIVVK
jgi:plastocyanin